ncbi:MAG TPA: GTPase domain-containing protein [Thermodesulfovibrionales bacterium]|nr:GTPase domain-containing protein [Thermodesulfovibrionales bacterium]
MALFNYATKEITIKIVYYGPGLSGKTTNLQYLHSIFDPSRRGKLLSLATEADRTLFFDFLPIELGKISDFSIRFQLYTVPGQVRYNATRKLVLKGADAIIFVADSQREMKEQNIESIKNMYENLTDNGINSDDIPVLLQFNKRDLASVLPPEELNRDLNPKGLYEHLEAVAISGKGVEESFQRITKLVIKNIARKHKVKIQPSEEGPETAVPHEKVAETRVSEPAVAKAPEATMQSFLTSQYEPAEESGEQVLSAGSEIGQEVLEEDLHEPTYDTAAFQNAPQATEIRETVVRREVPAISPEKVEAIISGMAEMTLAVKDLKNVLSGIHAEIRDVRKEQKEIGNLLRSIVGSVENLQTKKSWFRFS